jgi:acyl transferase domain-containing protein/acyl carrier protein
MENTSYRAIAIVGAGAVLPDAPNVPAFWENLKAGRYSITEVAPERWDPALYYDPDPKAPDKTYSKIGGWVREHNWDPIGWRMPVPPRVVDAMDEAQKWAIACTREALENYGYPKRQIAAGRTAVILGNAMAGEKHYLTALRVYFPEYAHELAASPSFCALPDNVRREITRELQHRIGERLPEITEDSMPGELANCIAGRIANIFDFHGPNFVVDAACASAMAAINSAMEGLVENEFDVAITGGVDRNMGASTFVKFSKIGALSGTGSRPYAEGADGFVMGEGSVIFVLKRLADAERDGDRIYAVLRGVGGSSDGRGKGITAPNPAGQKLCIQRAWHNAGLSPATATFIEGHGTSTRVGDVVEVQSMAGVLSEFHLASGSVALGSVKSNIGHLKGASGGAGMLKAALALHHKMLPPAARFEHPNPEIDFAHLPLYVNTDLRPWTTPSGGVRRAGVSAFGFGGANFHAVLEEYIPGALNGHGKRQVAVAEAPPASTVPQRGAAVIGGASAAELADRLRAIQQSAAAGRAPLPAAPSETDLGAAERVAIEYADAADLAEKSAKALHAIAAGQPATWKALSAQGVFRGHGPAHKVAFLYTGQGSQYVNMLAELRATEPVVAETFAEADRVLESLLGARLSDIVFVDPKDAQAMAGAEEMLRQTAITQPAVLTADLALTRLLARHGIRPDMVMGHSLGEYGALVAAGAMPFADALEAVSARGREMTRVSMADNGRMAAVFAPIAEVERLLKSVHGYVVIANINSNSQAVIGGASDAVGQAIELFQQAGYNAVALPVSHAFHTSIVAPASEPLKQTLRRLHLEAPHIPIVANVSGEFYPAGPNAASEMLDILGRQIASAVQFVKGLHTLYSAGARVFVEVGPKKALHGFVEDVLGERGDVVALFTNHPKLRDAAAFNQALCGLYAAGLGGEVRGTSHEAPVQPAASVPQVRKGNTGAPLITITGAALGLPGTERTFDDENVARILRGEQFIDVLPTRLRQAVLDKHITRLVKSDNGDPVFESIDNLGDVIKLAGRAGAFDPENEFGLPADRLAALDHGARLAIAAGIDALRDAGIPLLMRYKTSSKGTLLPDRWGLPDVMRDDTGVIFASAFPGLDSFSDELTRYHEDRTRRLQLEMLRDLRARSAGNGGGKLLQELDWRIEELRLAIERHPYAFDRRFIFRVLPMGHSQFAEIIGARGPNTQINSACASTAQGIALAEDWIAAGRCRRVIIISADDATSDHLFEWLGSCFLATGAAATDAAVEEAALPFDRRRHGMLLGMGAAALVVESTEAASERGIRPICEVLGAVTANSAYHGTRLDVDHIGNIMETVVSQAEARGGIPRRQLAERMAFVSHETYTPARGGSASAEIHALRRVFGDSADQIVITNTKGFTGHAMATGVEDVVAVKALETGCVPPVANFKEVDPELGQLNLSKGGHYPVEYALRLAAGFGSQISMTLLRWVAANGAARPNPSALGYRNRIADEAAWNAWLSRAAGTASPQLEVAHRTLRIRDQKGAESVEAVREAEPLPVATPAPVAAPAPQPPTKGDAVKDRVLALISEKTGYPVDMLELDLDLEADLGIDTVKQAEVFAAIREQYGIPRDENRKLREYPTLAHVIRFVQEKRPDLAPAGEASPAPKPVPAEPKPAAPAEPKFAAAAPKSDEVKDKVLALVAEKTGYPIDMLDLDLDLEADLGIDTVKQAEISAAIRESYRIPRDENRKLRDYPTLAHVVRFVQEGRTDQPAEAKPVAVDVPVDGQDDPLQKKILQIVSEKTGYPQDMLDLDLDLEADLGIDTVKQAEMFAAVRAAFDIPRDGNLKLRDFPTLAHVVQFARAGRPSAVAAVATAPPERRERPIPAAMDAATLIPRRVPAVVLRPPLELCKQTGVVLGPGCRVVVMPDEGGTAEALEQRLHAMGVETLPLDRNASADALVDCLHGWLAAGPVQGVYWLPALDPEGDIDRMDLAGWHEALRPRIKSLYLTLRILYDQISQPGTFLVAATRLGGRHGYDDTGAVAPLGGAVTGFTKTYKRERPDALVKAVDFEPGRSADEIAGILIGESQRDPGAVEIGHQQGLRWTVSLREETVADGQPGMTLDSNTVFVITGAAGSIVSAITADLATASGGTFYLLDLAPEPDPNNPDLARFGSDKEGLKRDLYSRIQARGERATPALVEKELAAIEREQAAANAIRAVRASGGTARYFRVDLTDADSVERVIGEVRERSGRIDVLLHAAGMERSHSLPDKDPREFDLVFDVKCDGWFNLMHSIGEMPLRASVVFSSIAGRFGNAGQADYSAANDLLCKMASSFRTAKPSTRAIAIDWTAWGGIGMATRGSIPKLMQLAGIDMLPQEAGIPWIRRELTAGSRRGEVIVGKGLGVLLNEWDPAGGVDKAAATRSPGPMAGQIVSAGVHGGLKIETTLDPAVQPFLHDHRIDGTPVLPGVMGIEAFAEAAQWMLPDWHVEALEDVNFLAPVKFYRNDPRTLTIHVAFYPDGDGIVAECRLSGQRSLPNQAEPQWTTHFTGRVRLVRRKPAAVTLAAPPAPATSVEAADIYRVYFHGPAYQVMQRAWLDGGCIVGQMASALPAHHQPCELPLATEPRLIELCFQTAGIWQISVQDSFGLPQHLDRVCPYRPANGATGALYAVVTFDAGHGSFDADVLDSSGNCYVHLSGYHTIAVPGRVDAEPLKALPLGRESGEKLLTMAAS